MQGIFVHRAYETQNIRLELTKRESSLHMRQNTGILLNTESLERFRTRCQTESALLLNQYRILKNFLLLSLYKDYARYLRV